VQLRFHKSELGVSDRFFFSYILLNDEQATYATVSLGTYVLFLYLAFWFCRK